MKIKKGETYAEFIKRVRLKAKLTQVDFATKIGYHPATVSAWERGRPVPHFTQKVIDYYARKVK